MTSRTLRRAVALLLVLWPIAAAPLHGGTESFGVRLTIREPVGVALLTAADSAAPGGVRADPPAKTLAVPAAGLPAALVMQVYLAPGGPGTAELLSSDDATQPTSAGTVTVLLQ